MIFNGSFFVVDCGYAGRQSPLEPLGLFFNRNFFSAIVVCLEDAIAS